MCLVGTTCHVLSQLIFIRVLLSSYLLQVLAYPLRRSSPLVWKETVMPDGVCRPIDHRVID